tara:strand:- start:34441 stop:34641 length:201 start_codon:yes stop_codon:yes gene_type:complete
MLENSDVSNISQGVGKRYSAFSLPLMGLYAKTTARCLSLFDGAGSALNQQKDTEALKTPKVIDAIR